MYDFELKLETNWTSYVFFKIFILQNRIFFTFYVINWLNFDLDQDLFSTLISPNYTSKRVQQTWYTSENRIRLGDISEDIMGPGGPRGPEDPRGSRGSRTSRGPRG